MSPPTDIPHRYADSHKSPAGPGDARPTAFQILQDEGLLGKMADKTFFVTGGTNGIGIDTVRQLAKTGAVVFFTARDAAKGERIVRQIRAEGEIDEDLKAGRVEAVVMNNLSLSSVKAAAEDFVKRSDQLNVLINNAGIASTPHGLTEEGFEQQFGVNHLAHFYLFQLLKPLLLSSSTPSFNSRVINLSSSAHEFSNVHFGDYNLEKLEGGYNPLVAYGQSKTANIFFSNEIERRYGSRGLHSLSVHPGGILTGLQNSHDPSFLLMMKEVMKKDEIRKAMKSVEQGAATTVLAAVGKDYGGRGGFYMEDCGVGSPLPEGAELGSRGFVPHIYDPVAEKRLWEDSNVMCGLAQD